MRAVLGLLIIFAVMPTIAIMAVNVLLPLTIPLTFGTVGSLGLLLVMFVILISAGFSLALDNDGE